MTMWLGDFPEDFTTITCMFTTHQSTGAAVAPSTAFENADVLIYKNGNAAQKTSQNGVTMTSPFDSIVGLHCLVIDTSNDTGDVGFWVAGAVYTIVLSPDAETVDSVAPLRVIGQFGIALAGTPLTAAGTRAAVGLASANLDTQLDALPTNAELSTALGTADDAVLAAIAALNNISPAQVNAEVDTALADINLDHLIKSAVDTDFATTVHLGSVIGHLADNGTTATFDRTTDSLEAVRDRGDAAWVTATGFSTHSASDVWAVATRVLTAGTNIVLAKGTGVTGFNDLSAAQVNAEADTALADVGVTTTITGRIDAAITSRLASGSYTAPDNSSITAIKVQTDKFVFTVANQVDANVQSVNDVTVNGNGADTAWGP